VEYRALLLFRVANAINWANGIGLLTRLHIMMMASNPPFPLRRLQRLWNPCTPIVAKTQPCIFWPETYVLVFILILAFNSVLTLFLAQMAMPRTVHNSVPFERPAEWSGPGLSLGPLPGETALAPCPWNEGGLPGDMVNFSGKPSFDHFCVKRTLDFVRSLQHSDLRRYSQNGEDGVLLHIFDHIGSGSKFYVEFGVESGVQCNTRNLREQHGWTGVMFDGGYADPAMNLHRAFITVDNICGLFRRAVVPKKFDLLSVDIDFNDLHVLRRVLKCGYIPRVIVCEYNAQLGPYASATVPSLLSHHTWDQTNYYGASALAIARTLARFGYTLVYAERAGVNLFFIRNDELGVVNAALAEWVRMIYRPPQYGVVFNRSGHVHDKRMRAFVAV